MPSTRSRTTGPNSPSSDPNEIDALSVAYTRMFVKWDPIHDVLGDTPVMRNKREKWLPKEPNESDPSYEIRLNRSFIFPALGDTISKIVSKPFSKAVSTAGGELSEPLDSIAGDVDFEGTDLTTFGSLTFEDAIIHGLTFCLVDYPAVNRGLNLQQARTQNIRPYFTMISAQNFLGATHVKAKNGEKLLTSIRYLGTTTVPDGLYGEKEIRTVRRVTAPVYDFFEGEFLKPSYEENGEPIPGTVGHWEIWHEVEQKKEGDPKWMMEDSGVHTYPGIPLAVDYLDQTGFLEAQPPMERMAWKNIEHWQKGSDHNHILRFSRFGILFGSGFSEETIDEGITIGPNRMIVDPNEGARLQYVDSSGSVGAIKVGVEDLNNIERQMEVLGLAPFLQPSSQVKATGQVMNDAKSHSAIQEWLRKHEAFLRRCYDIAAVWVEQEIPKEWRIKIFSDFSITINSTDDMQIIGDARMRRDIDRTTFLEEGKRRGVFAETVDPEEVSQRLEEEAGDNLGGLGFEDPEKGGGGQGGPPGDISTPEDDDEDDEEDNEA
jgi:hypothetical protein